MLEEAKKYYQNLINNGDLFEVFPKATGNWEEDMKRFCIFYEENIKFIVDFENDSLDEDEHYFLHDDEDGDTSIF